MPNHMNYSRTCAAVLAVSALLSLSGCAALRVKMGLRVYLAQTPVESITVSMPNGPGIAPGEKSPLVVVVTQPGGNVLQTEGQGGGKVLWQDLKVTPTVVTVNDKGIVSLSKDPRLSEGTLPHVTITVPSHPDVKAEIDIPVRYNYNFTSNFAGAAGGAGISGFNGTDGSSGSTGSFDPSNPSPGGNGTNGSDGSAGQDGSAGGNAPAVQIRVALKPGSRPLLQVAVSAAGREKLYLIDPQGGSLTVKALGGPGGSGGKGGRGGRGGSGGVGIPPGTSGLNGSDGRNGWDGPPGQGGSITVTYDPQAKPFLAIIHLANGNGPPPIFNEQPVPPLW